MKELSMTLLCGKFIYRLVSKYISHDIFNCLVFLKFSFSIILL